MQSIEADSAPRPTVRGVPNPVSATFDLLGDRLTLTILRHAFADHARRFTQFAERTGAPPAVLTARLAALVDAGVLHRSPQPGERFEYRLTPLGLATWEILVCVWSWQREWTAEWVLLPEFLHTDCGHRGPPVLLCRECGRTVTAFDTEVELDRDALWHITSGRRRSARSIAPTSGDAAFGEIMEAIGDRWSASITGLALAGVRRFTEFRAALNMSPTTLTERLTRLVSAGILRRSEDGGREYRLTPRGRALFGVFAFLLAWAERAYPRQDAPGLRIRHRECGAVLRPALRCRGCEAEIGRADVGFESIEAGGGGPDKP
ncbi:winged helix-turn-helix transcriptional regulator [Nocardia huaxiensis]|uniref:winged helix-turn-helix transcriptional regulator n=1 Tax=Nocardia huaxiensis TaxID=2755382 RepID=UPI001E57DF71|nr:helix-turn-helix domain-containing protein [Nocardia huaxiensis]UFS98998.1 helix-turn-helix transcriptional regulator [Nocardia huaxiensis]